MWCGVQWDVILPSDPGSVLKVNYLHNERKHLEIKVKGPFIEEKNLG